MAKKRYNRFINELFKFGDDVKKQGHFIESMIIKFASLEESLKVYLAGHYRARGVKEKSILEEAYQETSFRRLIKKLEVLKRPDYKFIEELTRANNERNNIIHKLFRNKFKTFKEIQSRARLNCERIDECENKIYIMLKKKL